METNLEPPNSSSTTFNNGDTFLSTPNSSSITVNICDGTFLSAPNSTSQTAVNNGADFLPSQELTSAINGGNEEDDNDDDNEEVDEDDDFYIDDSNCSTPFVSAPSSPGRYSYLPSSSGFFYSAPASPMHFILASAPSRSSLHPATSDASSNSNNSVEFEFSARFDSPAPEIGSSMSSADELFLNGQIRPMKLCAHLQRPQKLPSMTLLESGRENDEDDDEDVFQRSSRDLRFRSRSQRRRTRSLSPLRSTPPFDWKEEEGENGGVNEGGVKEKEGGGEGETTPSGSSSRCSSAGRSSRRWVFLKDFLRSKSEGSSNNKFWHNINISFSPAKEKREKGRNESSTTPSFSEDRKAKKEVSAAAAKGKGGMTASKRRSAHEMHYAANRAQAEEMRKKTFLPYRQGLLGCLGFNSKSYGAFNGFARALNPVSSR